MKAENLLNMVDELSEKTAEQIRKDARRLLKSGCVDLEAWPEDYRLPKIILTALCTQSADQWRPLADKDRAEVINISRF